jgi:predicted metal-dependent enzyme (double-stranded beta helix superfamily)
MTAALDALVAAVEAALADPELADDRSMVEAMEPAMAALLTTADPIPAEAHESLDGEAVGNVLYSDPDGRFHVMAVVFPEGTSSGVHHHGCWGLIGYLRGGDEETRYWGSTPSEEDIELDEASRHVWHQGDITYLLPSEGEGWHRVRNPGPGTGVSVHVLCMTPRMHPHHYWDRGARHAVPFGFVEVAPGRWQARLS